MKRLLLLATMAAAALAGPGDSVCSRAEYMFFNRHLNTTWLDSAYNMLAAVHNANPTEEHCLYLWSRANLQKGDCAKTNAEKMTFYTKAQAIAETLIATNDQNPDGHCWWAVAHGRIGQTRGILNSLFMVPDLKRELNRTLKLKPDCATALDVLGVMYYELPGFAGGNLDKSEQYLKQGIAADSNYCLLRLDLAKVYVRERRWTAAKTQLSALLATDNPTFPGDAELDDKPEARQLLEHVKDKE